MRTTIRDIAAAAGVSATTVSLALRNHPRISPATRERIAALAEEMGYQPDPSLLALNKYRHKRSDAQGVTTLGWINAWPNRARMYQNPNYSDYRKGAEAQARKLGYHLEEFWVDGADMTWARICDILRNRGIKGALLPPVAEHGAVIEADWSGLSVIAIGHSVSSPQFNTACSGQTEAARLAMTRLVERGFRRIGFYFQRPGNYRTDYRFMAGYLVEAYRFGLRKRIPPLICDSFTEEFHRDEFLAWVKRHQPEVILTLNSLVWDWLREENYRIPEDISIAHLALPISRQDVALAGVDQCSEVVGRKSVDLLAGLILHNESGIPDDPSQTIIKCKWVDGETMKPEDLG
ncbi:LacI family DNA-binding transcriptional regulator [Cerasicoccus frondis]|uniref:LacI family DNA-binding transcriptional regulator n=1 Tax=Cerasicoccus frondis TaxID=490090 RepID=UPI0028529EC3|nr:LacI family DNA-binding transcriptional regulator [Cerasicoccus frondis]